MEGNSRFSDGLLEKIRLDIFDGRSMVDVSKSILLVDYDDDEYNEDFFDVFNLLVDESDEKDADYGKIEALYKSSFLHALSGFRAFYRI